MKKNILKFRAVTLSLILFISIISVGCAKQSQLVIMHTNDTHSYFAGINEYNNACIENTADCIGGMAKLDTILSQEKNKKNTLILDAGDRFQGTLFYAVFKGNAVGEVFNNLPYDALTFGNHEFDDGCQALAEVIDTGNTPLLAANIIAENSCPVYGKFQPYFITKTNGLKVAVIGLASEETAISSSPCKNMEFTNAEEALENTLKSLKNEKIDAVIVLSHNGYTRDIELAQKVEGIDIIVGGHSHTLLSNTIENSEGPYPTVITSSQGKPVLIVTAKYATQYVGKLEVNFDKKKKMQTWKGDVIPLDSNIANDATMKKQIDAYSLSLEDYNKTIITNNNITGIPDTDAKLCRRADCLAGMLVADAFLEYGKKYGAQAAIINGGSIRETLPKGKVTKGNVLSILPYGNKIVVFDILGENLLSSLEFSLAGIEEGAGKYLQVAGMQITYNSSKPKGSRLIKAEILNNQGKWEQIKTDQTYKISTLDYLQKGGDGYTLFALNPAIHLSELLDVEIMNNYLINNNPLTDITPKTRTLDKADKK